MSNSVGEGKIPLLPALAIVAVAVAVRGAWSWTAYTVPP
jgi:hypothetical protein